MKNTDREIYDLRINYSKASLNVEDVSDGPVEQFNTWFAEALKSKVYEPNAMALSTVRKDGVPSSRIVLLKKMRMDGFVFFTNYNSDKALDISQNPAVSLVFLWHELERQIRVEGYAEKIPDQESDDYFLSRPRESRLGAWASPQSEIIEGRNVLEQKAHKIHQKFEGKEVTRPDFWGGYVVKPQMIEFWQGRPGRLHDRIRYVWKNKEWIINRLAP
ncbi:MAG: pyridoxamine 5'-phosphate oxidase [Bacteroidales bacterium]|nr:pyridoxamine 5'-phosphate oxidase [Bacteroidales bacterium]